MFSAPFPQQPSLLLASAAMPPSTFSTAPPNMSIERLRTRIASFEKAIQSASQNEAQFNAHTQSLTNSLDAFIAKHLEEDRHLTRLIQHDTQRSRDVRDEYDVLASRFDETVRPPSPTRMRELLSTLSVYTGILVSVVFMAPLSAAWWLLEKVLARVGVRQTPPVDNELVRRRRDRVSSRSGNRAAVVRASRAGEVGEVWRNGKEMEQSAAAKGVRSSVRHASSDDEVSEGWVDAQHAFVGSSDGKDDVQEACDHGERGGGGRKEAKNKKQRPTWAQPGGSSDSMFNMASFPSDDFWNISEHDILLDYNRERDAEGRTLHVEHPSHVSDDERCIRVQIE